MQVFLKEQVERDGKIGLDKDNNCSQISNKKGGLHDIMMKVQSRKCSKASQPFNDQDIFFDNFQVTGYKVLQKRPSSPVKNILSSRKLSLNQENQKYFPSQNEVKNISALSQPPAQKQEPQKQIIPQIEIKNISIVPQQQPPILSNLTLKQVLLNKKILESQNSEDIKKQSDKKIIIEPAFDEKSHQSLITDDRWNQGGEDEDDEDNYLKGLSSNLVQKGKTIEESKNLRKKEKRVHSSTPFGRKITFASMNCSFQREKQIDTDQKNRTVQVWNYEPKNYHQVEYDNFEKKEEQQSVEGYNINISKNYSQFLKQNTNFLHLKQEKFLNQIPANHSEENQIAYQQRFPCKMPVKTRQSRLKRDDYIENVLQEQRKKTYLQNKQQIKKLSFYTQSLNSPSTSQNSSFEYSNLFHYNQVVGDINSQYSSYSKSTPYSTYYTPQNSHKNSSRDELPCFFFPKEETSNQSEVMSAESKSFLKYTCLDKQFLRQRNNLRLSAEGHSIGSTTISPKMQKNVNYQNQQSKKNNENFLSMDHSIQLTKDDAKYPQTQNGKEIRHTYEIINNSLYNQEIQKQEKDNIHSKDIEKDEHNIQQVLIQIGLKRMRLKSANQPEQKHNSSGHYSKMIPNIFSRKISIDSSHKQEDSNYQIPHIQRKLIELKHKFH